jgi:hypothetical protein
MDIETTGQPSHALEIDVKSSLVWREKLRKTAPEVGGSANEF